MKTIAFVCTGNTCRSPMAEHIMRDMLSKRNIEGYAIKSFGVYAVKDSPISLLAANELKNRGINAVDHRARQWDSTLQQQCDLVITMTEAHLSALGELPNAKTMDSLTGCGDILDPYGGIARDYHVCAEQIEGAIDVLIDKLSIIIDNNK